ncbi:hypothetical protein Thiowin_03298 [Thiorhodovibrio winogradskyi]|uniref:Uncharacterized protein n=1 Tax=Thiorhodovibrio winogradskyi TaxID=77007 RepID=A0ABZ0SDV5_9GAMM
MTQEDRRHARMGRLQPNAISFDIEALQGDLIAIDLGDHGFTVVSGLTLLDDDDVAVLPGCD